CCSRVRQSDAPGGGGLRETAMRPGRRAGELERHYADAFDRLAGMIAAGSFPFARDEVQIDEAPRVADGVIVLDDRLRVRFASPNAISSLHRMGIYAPATGFRL